MELENKKGMLMRTKRFYIFFLLFVFILSSLSSDVMSARWKVRKRRPRIKYRDLNVVIGIKKEVYFDFPLGIVQSTNAELFKFDVYFVFWIFYLTEYYI